MSMATAAPPAPAFPLFHPVMEQPPVQQPQSMVPCALPMPWPGAQASAPYARPFVMPQQSRPVPVVPAMPLVPVDSATPPRSALDIDGTACATQRFLEEVDEALDGVKATLRRDLGAVLSSLDELGEASAAFARETRAKTRDFEKTIEAHDRYAKELRDILGG